MQYVSSMCVMVDVLVLYRLWRRAIMTKKTRMRAVQTSTISWVSNTFLKKYDSQFSFLMYMIPTLSGILGKPGNLPITPAWEKVRNLSIGH